MARAAIKQLAWIAVILALGGCGTGPSGEPDAGEAACRHPGGNQATPALASNGTDFLAVWGNLAPAGEPSSLAATRISASGEVVGPCVLIDLQGNEPVPAVVAAADDYWITWDDRGAWMTRLPVDRQVMEPILLSSSGVTPALAFAGSDLLAAWTFWGDVSIRGTRVRPPGEILDPGSFRLSMASSTMFPAVASDGQGFLAVWALHDPVRSRYEIGGAVVAADGSLAIPADIVIGADPRGTMWPTVASNGEGYFAAWAQSDGVFGARISPAGDVLDTGIPIGRAGVRPMPAIASDGDRYLVVWSAAIDADTGEPVVQATRIDAGGQPVDPSPFQASASSPFAQVEPSVAWNGETYLVAWQQSNGTDDDIVATRVSAAGEVLDPDGILIAGGPPEPDRGGCSVAGWNGAGLPFAALVMLLRAARRRVSRRSRAG